MAKLNEIQSLRPNDRIRWMPDPPVEGTVVTADYSGVDVDWDDGQSAILSVEGDRRWAYIEVEQRVRDREFEGSQT
jgi:hypothetical protein